MLMRVFTARWWHQRWLPCTPGGLWVAFCTKTGVWRWQTYTGNPERTPKTANGRWRSEWPWIIFEPRRNKQVYAGWYSPVFWAGMPWVKIWPITGQVALRIGDGDLRHTAVTWFGGRVKLEPVSDELPEAQLPKEVTKT